MKGNRFKIVLSSNFFGGGVSQTKGFINLKNHFENQNKGFIKFGKHEKTNSESSFQNQGPDNTGSYLPVSDFGKFKLS
jgi:hypothetical protein